MFGVGFGNEKGAIALRAILSRPDQHNDLATPDITYYNVFVALEGTFASKKKKNK